MIAFSRADDLGASPELDLRASPEALRAAPSYGRAIDPEEDGMAAQTVERQQTNRTIGPAAVVAYAGAVAFVIAAVWFWLVTKAVTVTPAPRIGSDVSPQQGMRIYYHWLAMTLPQERYYTSIAVAGFLCLAAVASSVRALVGRDRTLARIGALLVGTGSLLWIAGNVLVLGGHRAVGLMAMHANPIQATNSIAFTIDTIGQAFALAAFALIGVGMLGLVAAVQRTGHGAWASGTIVTALVMLFTAGCFATSNNSLSDLMLFISGVLVLPLWLIWTGLTGSFQQEPRSAL
jgi:hypothetical protein